ncbi:hypothetical protein GCM10020219_039460 [Nonomuraea dietziae]
MSGSPPVCSAHAGPLHKETDWLIEKRRAMRGLARGHGSTFRVVRRHKLKARPPPAAPAPTFETRVDATGTIPGFRPDS